MDEAGSGITGAEIILIGWGDASLNNGKNIITVEQGSFLLNGLYRRSVLMRVKAEGYYDELIPLDLQRPLSEESMNLEPIIMTKQKNGRVRMSFAVMQSSDAVMLTKARMALKARLKASGMSVTQGKFS